MRHVVMTILAALVLSAGEAKAQYPSGMILPGETTCVYGTCTQGPSLIIPMPGLRGPVMGRPPSAMQPAVHPDHLIGYCVLLDSMLKSPLSPMLTSEGLRAYAICQDVKQANPGRAEMMREDWEACGKLEGNQAAMAVAGMKMQVTPEIRKAIDACKDLNDWMAAFEPADRLFVYPERLNPPEAPPAGGTPGSSAGLDLSSLVPVGPPTGKPSDSSAGGAPAPDR